MQVIKIIKFGNYQHYRTRGIKWIKLHLHILDDLNFWYFEDWEKWLWIGLLMLAGKMENQIPYDEDFLRSKLALRTPKLLKDTLNKFVTKNMIEFIDVNKESVKHFDSSLLDLSQAQSRVEKSRVDKKRKDSSATPPDELKGLALYETDKKLISRWPELMKAWKQSYPGVNILAEIKKAHAWETANPDRRKINRARFLTGWLSRCQDSPRERQAGADPHNSGAFEQSVAEPKCDLCHNPAPTPIQWRNVTAKSEIELISKQWPAMARTEALCSACMEKLNGWLKQQNPPVQATGKGLEPAGKTADEILAGIKQPI